MATLLERLGVELRPLYAGVCIDRIADIRPARELVRELAS
jgi:hypothetical protein